MLLPPGQDELFTKNSQLESFRDWSGTWLLAEKLLRAQGSPCPSPSKAWNAD